MFDLGKTYSKSTEVTSDEAVDDEKYFPSMYLDEEQIKGLGLDAARVGDERLMMARVRVRSLHESLENDTHLDVEIVEAKMKPVPEEKDTASILYGDD